MPSQEETCAYVARKNEPSTWHGDTPDDWQLDADAPVGLGQDTWSCPHGQLPGEEYEHCAFHTAPADLPERVDEAELFVEVVTEAAAQQRVQFVGATFGEFRLQNDVVLDAGDKTIRLDHAVFSEGLTADGVTFDSDVFSFGTQFETGSADASDRPPWATAGVSFTDASFNGDSAVFAEATFSGHGGVSFENVTATGAVGFPRAEFGDEREISFAGAVFNGWTSFGDATFVGDADVSFQDATFGGHEEVTFSDAAFTGEGRVTFSDAAFTGGGEVSFKKTSFSGAGKVSFENTVFSSESEVSFRSAEFSGGGRKLLGFEFVDTDVSFTLSEFGGGGTVRFGDAIFSNSTVGFESAEFTGSGSVRFGSATFTGGCAVSFDRATFSGDGRVRFTGVVLDETSLVSFEETSFSGGDVSFRNGDFRSNGSVSFKEAEFRGNKVSFENARFYGNDSVLSGESSVSFRWAEFSGGKVSFKNAQLRGQNGVSFDFAEFDVDGRVEFSDAEFTDTTFRQSTFASTEGVYFEDSEFDGDEGVNFTRSQFDDEWNVSFKNALFRGEGGVVFRRVEFANNGSVWFDSASFENEGAVGFDQVEFTNDGSVRFESASFENGGAVVFNQVEFVNDERVWFESASFENDGAAVFRQATFDTDAITNFNDVTFAAEEAVTFAASRFTCDRGVSFKDAEFVVDVSFPRTEFVGPALFDPLVDSEATVSFSQTEILDRFVFGPSDGVPYFRGQIDFSGAMFQRAPTFRGTESTADRTSKTKLASEDEKRPFDRVFVDAVDFTDATFQDGVDLSNTRFPSGAEFSGASLAGADLSNIAIAEGDGSWSARFDRADLSGVNLAQADLAGASIERARLNRAELLEATLVDAGLYGALLGDARIGRQTTFWRHDNTPDTVLDTVRGTSSRTLSTAVKDILRGGTRPYCVYDPRHGSAGESDDETESPRVDPEKAAEVYGTLESAARDNSLAELASESFLGRKDMQLAVYRENRRWVKRLRSVVPNVVARYGESPQRVLASGAFTILACGVLYHAFDLIERSSSGSTVTLFDSLYFSALTFTTLGYGDFSPVSPAGQLLAVVETSFGVILLAILVFVFGRRATR